MVINKYKLKYFNPMKVQELYDYITAKMTPEAALMKMLEASIVNYDKLKFAEGEEIHPEMLIFMAANDRGWNIAFQAVDPKNPDSEIRGMIVGSKEYIDEVLSNYEDQEEDNEENIGNNLTI